MNILTNCFITANNKQTINQKMPPNSYLIAQQHLDKNQVTLPVNHWRLKHPQLIHIRRYKNVNITHHKDCIYDYIIGLIARKFAIQPHTNF